MNWEPVFWALVTGLVLYEFWTLFWTRNPGDHITAIIRRLAKRPTIPFALGYLMGHFFAC